MRNENENETENDGKIVKAINGIQEVLNSRLTQESIINFVGYLNDLKVLGFGISKKFIFRLDWGNKTNNEIKNRTHKLSSLLNRLRNQNLLIEETEIRNGEKFRTLKQRQRYYKGIGYRSRELLTFIELK